MPRFRKRAVEVEAIRWLGEPAMSIVEAMEFMGVASLDSTGDIRAARVLLIPTLEGVMRLSPGDWLIRGVKGEYYPCRHDIFTLTYEPVS